MGKSDKFYIDREKPIQPKNNKRLVSNCCDHQDVSVIGGIVVCKDCGECLEEID